MDRKNYRAGGTVGITPSAAASTNAVMTGDDTQDEAVVWKRVLADLQRLSEIIDSNEGVITALDKVPEAGIPYMGSPFCLTTIIKYVSFGIPHIKDGPTGLLPYAKKLPKRLERKETMMETFLIARVLTNFMRHPLYSYVSPPVDNTPEGKRKKRKIEAEGLISNSKKIRRYSSTDPNGIIPVGHQGLTSILGMVKVAARTPKDKNKVEEWILARVLAYYADKNRYHVEDDEADENGEKMKYQLSARSVIMIADDQEDIPEFPAGHTVLALYPSTTCFYKAIVVQPPSKNKDNPTPLYRIKFDDDEGNERTAPPRMVLDMPKLK
ncbi:hypothetical protein BGX21_003923 [Mortierella sp. AD011]|nr:hypothetical protein BGX21_003923 [Mortierella sp. AD011]